MKLRYPNRFGLIFANQIGFVRQNNKYQNITNMKKSLIIALSCLVVLFAACKKPVEPTPTPVDHTVNYVGNYLGQFTLSINSMNNNAVSNMSFPVDSIRMDITKGAEANAITATVTVDNEAYHTSGTATIDKADFEVVHLVIDKPDQKYMFNLDLKLEGTKALNDTLNIVGTFSGNGNFTLPTGDLMLLNEVSGNVNGKLVKQ